MKCIIIPQRYNMKTPQKYHPSLFSPAVASVPLLPSLSSYRLTNFVYFQHTSGRCLWEGRLSVDEYIWRNLIWSAFCFITISHHCSKENHSSWCGEDCQSTYRFNYRDFENCILPLNPSKRTWEPGEVIYAFCKCVMHNCTPCVVEEIEIEKCEIRIMMKQW